MPVKHILTGRRGDGYLEDLPDADDWNFDKLALGSSDLPDTLSHREHVKFILDQRSTNSCVAHAICNGIATAEGVQFGITDPLLVSRLFTYWNARSYHGATSFDMGTYLRYCIKGIVKYGMPDENWQPFNSFGTRKAPPWRAYQHAFDRRGPSAYYRIFETGHRRTTAIRAALHAGHIPCFGTAIDKSFIAADGDHVVGPPKGDIVGGHAMFWVGYRIEDGQFQFLTVNSWGRNYRDAGCFWMTQEYVESANTRDIQIIQLENPLI